MSNMFYGAHKFNQPLNKWNVSKVINMNNMFYNAYDFNQPIGNWKVSENTELKYIFYNSYSFNQPLLYNWKNIYKYQHRDECKYNPINKWINKLSRYVRF